MQRKLTRPPWRLYLALWAGLSLFAGCDLLGSGGETTVSGVVVDAETGDPLENIWVTLRVSGGRFGAYPAVAEDSTDAQGRFYLDDPVRRSSYPILYVNYVGHEGGGVRNPSYSTHTERIESNTHRTVRVELQPLDE